MNRLKLAAIAMAAIGVIILSDSQKTQIVEIKSQLRLSPSILYKDDAGNKIYVVQVKEPDGGIGKRSVAPDCVRRKPDAGITSCRRRLPDGGARDFGASNRFPASESVGTGCQMVACAVFAGQNAQQEE